jgi:hypothetical protein
MQPIDRLLPSLRRDGAHPATIGGLPTQLLASRESLGEDLSLRRETLDIAIDDGQGRRARIRMDLSELAYRRSYTRSSLAMGANEDLARSRSAGQVALQAEHWREETSITASRAEFAIEGDIGLLQDFFSIEKTAQRIMDFARGLGGAGAGDSAAQQRREDIARGVRHGMQQASDLLGGLPDISFKTVGVVGRMLDAWLGGAAAEDLLAERFLPAPPADPAGNGTMPA